jgi:hypothetical protein
METLQDKINEAREQLRNNEGKFREKNLIERLRGWIFENLINTKGGYLVVGIVIGLASTYIYLEAPKTYNYISTGKEYTEEFLIRRAEAKGTASETCNYLK